MSKTLTIVIGEGTDYEKVLHIERPKGKIARKMMPKILDFMASIKDMNSGETELESVLNLINTFWSMEEFEEVLVPYVLGLDDEQGRQYLDENCTIIELIESFTKAANFLIEESFSKAEVQQALGKSKTEAQTEARQKKVIH